MLDQHVAAFGTDGTRLILAFWTARAPALASINGGETLTAMDAFPPLITICSLKPITKSYEFMVDLRYLSFHDDSPF
jgi:hypothetical protein